ncbi:beta strand repeat-containing protein [Rhodopirellula europaea]|uniref:beta strand repeat-containing protein n=1 Tax=Rhodopirellula europaea TaxID=1263866 RepID=UPI001F02B33F|nr:Calx-beta domain-containing protein [Rhodopirellula europaea]
MILDGTLQAGEVAVVNLDVTFPNGSPSNDPAEATDFDNALLTDILNSITSTAAASGTYSAALVGGSVQITYTHGATDGTVDKLLVSLNTSDDDVALNNLVEGPEDFVLTISDDVGLSTSGAADVISPTEFTHTATIIDGDTATFTLTQPAAQDTSGVSEGVDASYTLTLDGTLQGGETASVEIDITLSGANPADTADFTDAFLQDVDDAIALYNSPSGSYARVGNVLTYTKGASDGTVADLTILLPAVDDAIVEGDETFTVSIDNVTTPSSSGATIALGSDVSASTVIKDNDTATFTVEDVTVNEADGTIDFIVTVDKILDIDVDVEVSFTDGTATSPGDYDSTTQTLTFLANDTTAGNLSQTVSVPVVNDAVVEPTEAFTVGLSVVTAVGTRSVDDSDGATGTIVNDDAELSIADAGSLDELNDTQTQTFNFVVTRSGDTSSTASATYTVSGADVDGLDFVGGTLPTGTVNFLAGESTATITVSVEGDNVVEMDEDFTVTLSGASSGTPGGSITITDADGDATIVNDDIDLSIAPAADDYETNDTQTQTFDFVVTRYGDKTGTTTATYNVVGTGTNPADAADFGGTFPTGTVTFLPTETTATISITVAGDNDVELDENFTVNLTSPADDQANHIVEFRPDPLATGPNVGLGFLIDGDTFSQPFSITNIGDPGVKVTEFTFNLAGTGKNFDTSPSTGVAFTPAGGSDLTTGLVGPVSVPDTATSFTINFTDFDSGETFSWDIDVDDIGGNNPVDGNELIGAATTITFSDGSVLTGILEAVPGNSDAAQFNIANASLLTGSASATILNDDIDLELQASPETPQAEGDVPATTDYTFEVTRDGFIDGSTEDTTVEWAVTGIGANPATGDDFVGGSLPMGTVTFGPGETTKTITVDVMGDSVAEADEDFRVTLSGQANADITTIGGTLELVNATEDAVIENDDVVNFEIADVTVNEGDPAVPPPTVATFTITRDNDADKNVSVVVSTADGTATVADSDYTAKTETVVFAPGEFSKTFTVDITRDLNVELDETFLVNLTDAAYDGTVGAPQVNLNAPASLPAPAGVDTDSTAIGTINNDDALIEFDQPGITIGSLSNEDGTTGSGPVLIVTGDITGTSVASRTVTFSITGGTATLGTDYNFTGSIVIPEGDYSGSNGEFDLTLYDMNGDLAATSGLPPVLEILNDNILEGPETLNIGGLGLGTTFQGGDVNQNSFNQFNAAHTIADDESAVIQIVDTTVLESAAPGTENVPVTLTINGTGSGPVMIAPGVMIIAAVDDKGDGTATSGDDYDTFVAQNVVFTAADSPLTTNVVTKNVTLNTKADTIVEADETVNLEILPTGITTIPGSLNVTAAGGTVTIEDDDTATVSIVATTDAVEPGTNGVFTVSLTNPSSTDTVISYTVTGDANTGTIGNTDYTPLSGTVTILAGDTTATIDVAVLDDMILEDNETVTVTLDAITAGDTDISVGAANSDTVTISDDDTAEVTIAATTASASEPSTDGQFTVTIDKASDTDTVISYTVTGDANTGTIGNTDYTPLSGTVTILAGDTTATIDVEVLDDSVVEGSESVIVTLDAITAGDADISIGAANSDTVTISDEDTASVSIATLNNAMEQGEVDGVFTLTLTGGPASTDTIVNYLIDTSGVPALTASNGSDYTVGTATILAGQTTAQIVVDVIDDNIVEYAEAVKIALVDTSNPAITASGNASLNIIDNDEAVVVIVPIQDGNEQGSIPGLFEIQLVDATDRVTPVVASTDVLINFNIAGTATEGGINADFPAISNNETITAGNSSQGITLSTIDDTLVEGTETVDINLTSLGAGTDPQITIAAADATLPDDAATIDILDNDGGAVISFATPTVTVDESAGTATVTLQISAPVAGPFSVAYTLADGTANLGSDYTNVGVSGVATFTGGSASETVDIVIPISEDMIVEGDETFTLTLGAITGAPPTVTAAVTPAMITIEDNDGPAVVSVADVAVNEDDGTATVTVSVDKAVQGSFKVAYSTSDGTAVDGTDYTATSGEVTFVGGTAGEMQTFTIDLTNDDVVEDDETINVTLGVVTAVLPATPPAPVADITSGDTAVVTITNDDIDLDLTPATISQPEGDSGTTTYTFTVTRTGLDTGTSTANWTVTGAAANAADISSSLSGTVSFAPTVNTATITVDVIGDLGVEADEDFTVTLSGPSDSGLGTDADSIQINNGIAVGTITNDDGATVSVADVSVDEGGTATVTLTLDQAVAGGLTVFYSTTGGTATIVDDFVGASGSVIFAGTAGETETFTIATEFDADVEGDETINVTLDSVTGALAGGVTLGGPAVVTITDNDIDLTLGAASPSSQDEGNPGDTTTYTFTVTRSGLLTAETTVNYDVSGDVTADDFASGMLPSGTLVFGAGVDTATITIELAEDTTVESDEDFTVTLSMPSHTPAMGTTAADSVDLIDNNQTATIVNDDTTSITVSDPVVREGSTGNTLVDVDITLIDAVQGGLDVDWSTVDGTAESGDSDYVPVSPTTISFAGNAGETVTVTVEIVGDTDVELDEAFNVVLSNLVPGDAGLAAVTATPSATLSFDGTTLDDTPVTPPTPAAAFAVTGETDADTLASTVIGSGFTLVPGSSSLSAPSAAVTSGTFEGGLAAGMGLESGIVLSTGAVQSVDSSTPGGLEILSGAGDPTLATIAAAQGTSGNTTYDASVLTFEVNGSGDLSLDFVFASQEYGSASLGYADVIAITVDGVNIALTPGSAPVSSLTASALTNPNTGLAFAGATEVFSATATGLLPGDHIITIRVADHAPEFTDGATDSAIFIGANSLTNSAMTSDPFTLENTSGANSITLTDLSIDLGTKVFDTNVSTDDGTVGSPFTPVAGAVATGQQALVSPSGDDNTSVLSLEFTDFESGETFEWTIDVDDVAGTDNEVTAAGLLGASVTATFDNGGTPETVTATFVSDGGTGVVAEFVGTPLGVAPIDISDEGNVTIENDDIDLELLATTTPSLNEGNVAGDDTTYTFEVTRDGFITGSGEDTTVEWAIDFGASDADASDFETPTSGTLTFGPTETSKFITIKLAEDTTVESDEDFVVTLTNPANVDTDSPNDGSIDLVNDTASATIANDDQVAIVIDDVTANEEAGAMTFTVSLDDAVDGDVVVDLATVDGTTIEAITGAVGDDDFDLSTTQVTLNAGNSYSALVTVTLNDDSVVEGDETFTLGVSGITATIVDTSDIDSSDTGLGTITNTDTSELSVSASLPNAAEPSTDGEFTFSLTNPSSTDTTFTYQISGTATAGSDYGTLTGTEMIPAGDLFVEVTVDVLDDNIIEPDETVIVDLDTITVGAIGFIGIDPDAADQTATVNIDSEDFGYIVVRQADVTNGSETGPTSGEFLVSLNSMPDGTGVDLTSTEAITVQIQSGGTATATSDFTSLAGTATIAIGASSTAVSVNVLDDGLVEGTETVTLTATALVITSPDFTLGTADSATVSIFDNDNAPVATDDTLSIAENSPNATSVGFVSATDADLPADTLTYTVTGGTGSTAFAVDPATGEITVADSAQLDFETTPSFTLDVEVEDSSGNTDTATVTINLTDEDEGTITIGEMLADSSQWEPIFRDFVDGGFNDGVSEGYRFLSSTSTSLPWVNVDRLKIQFSADVGASLDVSDFELVGLDGFEASYAPGATPSITGVTFDASTFIATVQLDTPLSPNIYYLDILAAGISTTSSETLAGGDQRVKFVTLPGDSVDLSSTTGGFYIVSGNDAQFVQMRQAGFIFDDPSSTAFDGPYFNYDVRADVNGDGQINTDDAQHVQMRQASFVLELTPPPAARMSNDESSLGLVALNESLSGEAKLVDSGDDSAGSSELLSASEILAEGEGELSDYEDAVDSVFGDLEDELLN